MSAISTHVPDLPPEQQAIRDKCFHPTGTFIEYKQEEVEQSIPARFEEQVRKYPQRIAVKTESHELTYDELNKAANRVAQTILAERGEGLDPVPALFDLEVHMVAVIL